MKAEIVGFATGWCWVIYYANGVMAADGPVYSSEENARRGLKRFLSAVLNNHLSLWEQADEKSD